MPFQIVRNDITKMQVDVIVNTANPRPIVGAGTDSAIYDAAGKEELLAKRKEIGDIVRGELAVTPAFHLSAKYIIHTVAPAWQDGKSGESEILRSCYAKSMAKAVELGGQTMAFPLLASGVYGFPNDKAIQIAISTITTELMNYDDLTVYLVIFSERSFELVTKIFGKIESQIDSGYVKAAMAAEYALSKINLNIVGATEEDQIYLNRRRQELQEHFSNILKEEGSSEASSIPTQSSEETNSSASPKSSVMSKDTKPAGILTGSIWKSEEASKGALEKKLDDLPDPFHDKFYELINASGMSNKEIYSRANLTRQHFSKLLNSKDSLPKKKTVLALCVALKLNLEETEDLLARAEWALNPSNATDIVVKSFIENKVYSVYQINCFLMDHHLETL